MNSTPEPHYESELINSSEQHETSQLRRSATLGIVSSVCTTLAVAAFVAWDGRDLSPPADAFQGNTYLWFLIFAQALCLMSPPLGLIYVCSKIGKGTSCPALVPAAVNAYFLGFPIIMVLDALVFPLIGQRLFSNNFAAALSETGRLVPFVGGGSLKLCCWFAGLSLGVPALAWSGSKWLDQRTKGRLNRPFNLFGGILYLFAFVAGAVHLFTSNPKLPETMGFQSSAHPFHVFRILRTPTVGPVAYLARQQPTNEGLSVPPAIITDQQSTATYLARERRIRFARPKPPSNINALPDVVLVVIESLRPELVSTNVMPNLTRLAAKGMHCRTHFSGGNATNHGVFSLVTGLEPLWFGTSQRYEPGMFRVFKSLGYETGFFAGADDWDDFQMSGFIRPQLFDNYEVRPRDGIASDRHAVELASAFISRAEHKLTGESVRKPRFAFLYLYGTHATYQSYPSDQIDQPAADNRFPFPYPARMRETVWNRYRNSARTVDRLLKALLQRDCIIVAVGDHGEAFLEDGTIGHGIRLSRFQNMTPAVLYCPGESPQVIQQPTCHADIFPTLLSFLKVKLTDPQAIDGVSLSRATKTQLAARRFCVRNYLGDDYGLIGPWTSDSTKPFAYRFTASIRTESATPLNAIDDSGRDTEVQDMAEQALELSKWKARFYRNSAVTQ